MTDKYNIRNISEIQVLKAFLYKGYGGDIMSIHIYDKVTKKVYVGNIGLSSYKKEEIK